MENIKNELLKLNEQKNQLLNGYSYKLISKEDFIKNKKIINERIELKEIQLNVEVLSIELSKINPEFFDMFPYETDLIIYEMNECSEFLNSDKVEMMYKKEKLNKVEKLLRLFIEKYKSTPFFMTTLEI